MPAALTRLCTVTALVPFSRRTSSLSCRAYSRTQPQVPVLSPVNLNFIASVLLARRSLGLHAGNVHARHDGDAVAVMVMLVTVVKPFAVLPLWSICARRGL